MARGDRVAATDAEDAFYVPGFWYYTTDGIQVSAGGAAVANQLRLAPFRLRQIVNIAQLGLRITTLASGGFLQLAVYAANRDTLIPTGGPLIQTGNISTTLAANVAAASVGGNVQLTRGIYWFAVNQDATSAAATVLLSVAASLNTLAFVGASTQAILSPSSTQSVWIRTFSATFGTWPDLTGQTTTESTAFQPLGMFQVAA